MTHPVSQQHSLASASAACRATTVAALAATSLVLALAALARSAS